MKAASWPETARPRSGPGRARGAGVSGGWRFLGAALAPTFAPRGAHLAASGAGGSQRTGGAKRTARVHSGFSPGGSRCRGYEGIPRSDGSHASNAPTYRGQGFLREVEGDS